MGAWAEKLPLAMEIGGTRDTIYTGISLLIRYRPIIFHDGSTTPAGGMNQCRSDVAFFLICSSKFFRPGNRTA